MTIPSHSSTTNLQPQLSVQQQHHRQQQPAERPLQSQEQHSIPTTLRLGLPLRLPQRQQGGHGQAEQHQRSQQQHQSTTTNRNVTATFSTVRTTSQEPPPRPLPRVATSCRTPASALRRSHSINESNYSTGCATLRSIRSHSLPSTATSIHCSLCGRLCSRNKNGRPRQHNCRPVSTVASTHPLPSAPPRSPPHPLQAAPAASGTDITPTRLLSLLQPPSPVDLPVPDTIIPLVPLDALLALLPDGAPTPVADGAALPPLAPVTTRHRHASMVLWSAGHLHLLQTTIRSRTKGDFNDNLLALLGDSPPGAVSLPTLATMTPSTDLLGPPPDDYGGDDVVGISQASIPPTNRIIKAIDRHILNGDLVKARRATKGSGIANLSDPRVRANLNSKYPPSTTVYHAPSDADLILLRQEPIDHHQTIIDDTESLANFITSKKRGASPCNTGLSNDHFQDILKLHPSAINDIMILCNLIAIGSLYDGPARAKLVQGKGTALIKTAVDCRPIVTEHPYLKYTGHALVVKYGPDISTVCGKEQFMGASVGCEIVAHLIRNRLEADPSLVVGKVDCKNAFNEIHKEPILDVIREELPVLLPFAELLLSGAAIHTIYNNTRTKETIDYSMVNGVPQGGSMSGALFNLGQSRSIREASRLHPHVTIMLIADDTHVLGHPDEVIAAIKTTRTLYSRIGLTLAATTASKNVLFGLGQQYTDAQRLLAMDAQLHWLPSTAGLEVGGTPVGHYNFVTESVNKCVDKIIDELNTFATYIDGPNGTMKARVQTMCTMIRQCTAQQFTYLLRTCPPSTTHHAACRLNIATANTIFYLTDSNSFLPPPDSAAMQDVLNRLFLSIRLGGMGMTDCNELKEAAYVASLLQCAPHMRDFCPSAGARASDTQLVTSLREFDASLQHLRARGVTCLPLITVLNIWTSRPLLRMQKQITIQLQALRNTDALRALPTGPPNTGGALNPLDIHDAARRRQGLTNAACRGSCAWLAANSSIFSNQMNDATYKVAVHTLHGFDQRGSRTHCLCGALIDKLWHHSRVCPLQRLKNVVTNPSHSTLKNHLFRQLQADSGVGRYIVHRGEPLVTDFIPRRLPLRRIHRAGGDTDLPARRADIAITSIDTNITTLIDVTIAAHNCAHRTAADYSPGHAASHRAAEKHRLYDRDFQTDVPSARLVIFAVDDLGAIHREAHQFLRELSILTAPDNPGRKLGHLLGSLSVSIQAARARSLTTARNLLSHDGPPPIPCTPDDPLPIVPPPTRLTPGLLPRRYALAPLPPRPALHQHIDTYWTPWVPPDTAPIPAQRQLSRTPPRDRSHVPPPALTDAPRVVMIHPAGSQPRSPSTSVPTSREGVHLTTSGRVPALPQAPTVTTIRPAGRIRTNHRQNTNNTNGNSNNTNTTSTHTNTSNICINNINNNDNNHNSGNHPSPTTAAPTTPNTTVTSANTHDNNNVLLNNQAIHYNIDNNTVHDVPNLHISAIDVVPAARNGTHSQASNLPPSSVSHPDHDSTALTLGLYSTDNHDNNNNNTNNNNNRDTHPQDNTHRDASVTSNEYVAAAVATNHIQLNTTGNGVSTISRDRNGHDINNLAARGPPFPTSSIPPTASHGVVPYTPPSDHIAAPITPPASHQLSFRTT